MDTFVVTVKKEENVHHTNMHMNLRSYINSSFHSKSVDRPCLQIVIHPPPHCPMLVSQPLLKLQEQECISNHFSMHKV